MKTFRERKVGIHRTLQKQYGKERAYEMYGEFITRQKPLCKVCGGEINDYSEWSDTGYELKGCLNGCWKHETHGMREILETKGFSFEGRIDETVLKQFEKQIEENAIRFKRFQRLFWKKKRSQRKRS